MAVGEGRPEVVEYLLDNDAEVNATDRYGHTPLDEALALDNMEMVALLENAGGEHSAGFHPTGADPTASGDTTSAPLTSNEQMLRARNKEGQTPLHLAAGRGETEIVVLLIEKGADIHAKDNNGRTPLQVAEEHGKAEIVALLR